MIIDHFVRSLPVVYCVLRSLIVFHVFFFSNQNHFLVVTCYCAEHQTFEALLNSGGSSNLLDCSNVQ